MRGKLERIRVLLSVKDIREIFPRVRVPPMVFFKSSQPRRKPMRRYGLKGKEDKVVIA